MFLPDIRNIHVVHIIVENPQVAQKLKKLIFKQEHAPLQK